MTQIRYDHILFDLDGTLVDSGEGITDCVAYAMRHFGLTPGPREELNRFIGPPLIDSFMRFCGMSYEQAREAAKVYRSRYRIKGVHENVLYPGVGELLRDLNGLGAHCVLATSKPEVFAETVLEEMGISEFFEFKAGAQLEDPTGRAAKLRSEKDEVIAYALESLAVTDRRRVLMVGDRKHDVIGAKKNGIDSVGVLYGYGSREELEEAGASFIAETPSGVLDIIYG